MKLALAVIAASFTLLAHPVRAAVTFEFIFDGGFPLAVSDDGSVIAGNLSNGGFGPFRWTQATGPASLGRVTHAGGGGMPGISYDGTRVASSIAMEDSSFTTQGLWTLGSGWQELMPPTLPDGGFQDGTCGNIYGLSGDGKTAVGLYSRLGVGNRAHASKWTASGGVVDLGGTTTGQASRANGVDFNGSVITGWVETPTGPWRPAAWVNGSLVLLTNYSDLTIIGSGEGRKVSQSGDIIVGFAKEPVTGQRAATMWKRTNGTFGPPQVLGWVDGTTAGNGINVPYGVSNDGRIVVGYCSFDGDPFATTGFIWTSSTGVQDINNYLADNGVFVDPNFAISSLSAITPDGTQVLGYGRMLVPPYTTRAFRITIPNLVAVPPAAPTAHVELSAPSPNPSSLDTRLNLDLAAAMSADLSIFDAAGRHVATLLHAELPAGRRSVVWDGREASGARVRAGLYFARLTTPLAMSSQRLVRIQ
jgi:flagellar hook capping protein FlgD